MPTLRWRLCGSATATLPILNLSNKVALVTGSTQ